MTFLSRVTNTARLLFLLLSFVAIAQVSNAQTPNWIYVTATGIPRPTNNTSAKPLYIYLASAGDIYIDDLSVVAGTVAGVGANIAANGAFETGAISPWTLGSTGNNSASAVTPSVTHSGNYSLHLVASAGGTTQNSSIWQDFSSQIATGGVYTLSYWYRQTTNGGPLIVRFSGGGIGTTNDPSPLFVTALNPVAGATVSNLTQIQVTFNKTATGVAAESLLVNGDPATSVSGSGQNYTFGFPQPPNGAVHVEWDVDNGITSLEGTPLDDSTSWSYTLIDANVPMIDSTFPAAGAVVGSLTEAHVKFSKSVTGVTASKFLINGAPATSVSGSGDGPYVFQFASPLSGPVNFSWAAGHNIRDDQSNLFGGTGWSAMLNPPAAAAALTNIVLNEILALNTSPSGLHDEDGLLDSWIEIYNHGTTPVSLAGWSLTDEAGNLDKWIFPATNIAAGQYLVVFASGKDRRIPGAKLHTNFKLSASGDYLGLYNAELLPQAVQEFAPAYPEQRNDISYGLDNTNALRYFATPTPSGPNGFSSISGVVAPLAASVPSGFFSAPFAISLSTTTPGVTMVYTTNGSVPAIGATATNGTVYSGLINIARTTPLRAVAFAPNLLPTLPLSQTYLFPEDIIRQPNNPSGYPTGNVWTPTPATIQNGARAYYQMDPTVVNDPQYTNDVRAGLISIPTMSLMLPISDLFNPSNGIYTHPLSRGDDWERACSMELIFPDGSPGAQANCALQIQGGTQRDPAKNAKHSFRVTFKKSYGPGHLDFPMYADSPVDQFNTFVLDGGINYWWHYVGTTSPTDQRYRTQCIRDQYTSDLMAAMGHPAYHGKFFHLYLNGLYWGINYVHERPDDDFCASYLGGDAAEYDVIKNTSSGTELVAGDFTAWNTALSLAKTALANNAQYELLQQYVNVDNLIDYMIVNHWVGNDDWPQHNWYVIRKRAPGEGFRFIVWDAEHVMKDVNINRTTIDATNSPAMIYNLLRNNAEFRLRFADHLQNHFFNNGIFYTDSANPIPDAAHPERNVPAAYYMKRVSEITNAIVDESARWGGFLLTTNYTRNDQWLRELNNLLGYATNAGNTSSYFPMRSAVVLNQYKSISLFPNVSAPVFSRFGGYVSPGFTLAMTNQNASGTIYYTTNGIDPRTYGTSAVYSNAFAYSSALPLNSGITVKARVLQSGTWSPVTEASFVPGGPEPYPLAVTGFYALTNWDATELAGAYPPNMLFYQVTNSLGDPGLTNEMDSLWTLPYNLTSRSRINGLGTNGFAFINTDNPQTNNGAGFVGAAVLGLNTLGKDNIQVSWTGGTVTPNTVIYAIRLQYSVGTNGIFSDVLDAQNNPVEYLRNPVAGHSTNIGTVTLPAAVTNQSYVQLRWKYYWISGTSGSRAQLRVANILVTSGHTPAQALAFTSTPSPAQTGLSLGPITVRAVGQNGFLADAYNGIVSISVAGQPGALNGTVARAATNGVAVFDDLVFQQAGTWNLTVSAAGLTSATSAAIQVLPGSPPPYALEDGAFVFTGWDPEASATTFPTNLFFYQATVNDVDPALDVPMDLLWTLPYNLTNRSRINGLGTNGFAFINTGNAQTNAGAGFVGAAVLGLNTLGAENIRVTWTGGTVTTNERIYGVRLQYRIGSGTFMDVSDSQSNPVEYLRNDVTGHSAVIGPVTLPASANNQPIMQLRWKYYYVSGITGARAQLSVSNIRVAVAPPAPILGNASLDGTGTIHFNFISMNGESYQLEYKNDLNDADWIPLGAAVNGTGGVINLSDDMSGHPQRFYRLIVQ